MNDEEMKRFMMELRTLHNGSSSRYPVTRIDDNDVVAGIGGGRSFGYGIIRKDSKTSTGLRIVRGSTANEDLYGLLKGAKAPIETELRRALAEPESARGLIWTENKGSYIVKRDYADNLDLRTKQDEAALQREMLRRMLGLMAVLGPYLSD